MDAYRIGEVAKEAGVNVQTLHYYERRGLIPEPRRSSAGYRQYDLSAVHRVQAIKRAQSLGFKLSEIKELMALFHEDSTGADLLHLVAGKLAQIDEKIALLKNMKRVLHDAMEACSCEGDLSRCDVIAGLGQPT